MPHDAAIPSNLEDVVADFVDRRLAGESITIEEFCALHPRLADELRDRLVTFEQLTALASDEPAPLSAGEVYGDYRIEELLGRGGMGFVYRATQLSLARQVAIKIGVKLSPKPRLFREARAIARLRHPNVIAVLAFEKFGTHGAMVMQYVDGESLDVRLRRGLTDDLTTILRSGASLASALQATHDERVIHRDIKPANVLIGRDGTPYLADYGLARSLNDDPSNRSGAYAGTPAYMSPEQ